MSEQEKVAAVRQPPQHIVELALEVGGWSPCRSKRGVVIHRDGDVIAHGHNYKPRGFECDGSDACKMFCRYEAVHAEEAAIVAAGGRPATDGAELVHVKSVDGRLVESGPPSCVRCSTLALAYGIAGVWLYQEAQWNRYPATLFHALSIDASRDGLVTTEREAKADAYQHCADEANRLAGLAAGETNIRVAEKDVYRVNGGDFTVKLPNSSRYITCREIANWCEAQAKAQE